MWLRILAMWLLTGTALLTVAIGGCAAPDASGGTSIAFDPPPGTDTASGHQGAAGAIVLIPGGSFEMGVAEEDLKELVPK